MIGQIVLIPVKLAVRAIILKTKEKLKTVKESDDDDFFDNLMEEKIEAYKDAVALCHKLEKEQEEEDTVVKYP